MKNLNLILSTHMDKSHEQNVGWKKSDEEDYILSDYICTELLEKKKALIYAVKFKTAISSGN